VVVMVDGGVVVANPKVAMVVEAVAEVLDLMAE
jgi:hypothetical protein